MFDQVFSFSNSSSGRVTIAAMKSAGIVATTRIVTILIVVYGGQAGINPGSLLEPVLGAW